MTRREPGERHEIGYAASVPGLSGNARHIGRNIRPLTIAEQVADAFGVMIVEGSLAPGERLGEEKLAEMYGVSRGPVREAFRILEKRRLVEIIPRRGAFVRPVTLASIEDLFNVRNALASMAAASFARRIHDQEGHARIVKLDRRLEQLREMTADPDCLPLDFTFQLTRIVYTVVMGSGNQLLGEIWADLNNDTFWTTIWKTPQDSLTVEERRRRLAQVEHSVAAIRDGDSDAAETTIRLWLEEIRDNVLANLQNSRPTGMR
ncbi:GntR family transcriptional regulator [Paracoccus alkanivorans]|nr:GntR family transcriptional regulator [Paracoccus alkanivorans]